MAEVSFSFSDLFGAAFGYQPPDFQFTSENKNQYTKLGSKNSAVDQFGREYFMPAKLGGIELPYPVLRISNKKRIVETSLVNREGSVKELISNEDWEIEVRGLMVEKNGFIPETAITQLRDWYKQGVALSFENAMTDILLCDKDRQGSNLVVIYDLEFPEVRGIIHVRPYFLKLKTDAPFELVKTITG